MSGAVPQILEDAVSGSLDTALASCFGRVRARRMSSSGWCVAASTPRKSVSATRESQAREVTSFLGSVTRARAAEIAAALRGHVAAEPQGEDGQLLVRARRCPSRLVCVTCIRRTPTSGPQAEQFNRRGGVLYRKADWFRDQAWCIWPDQFDIWAKRCCRFGRPPRLSRRRSMTRCAKSGRQAPRPVEGRGESRARARKRAPQSETQVTVGPDVSPRAFPTTTRDPNVSTNSPN